MKEENILYWIVIILFGGVFGGLCAISIQIDHQNKQIEEIKEIIGNDYYIEYNCDIGEEYCEATEVKGGDNK